MLASPLRSTTKSDDGVVASEATSTFICILLSFVVACQVSCPWNHLSTMQTISIMNPIRHTQR